MAQYPIPQFIEEEGKIVFFLTFRQFFLLIAGGVICIALYFVLPFFVFILLSLLIMALFAAIAFLKIGNEKILKVLLHFIKFSTKNKNYVWKKEEYQPQYQITKKMEVPEVKTIIAKEAILKTTTKSRLAEIKKTVEFSRR